MVATLEVPPDPSLLESMRSIGYTVESAVADIIDNSIAADASNVEVLFSADGPFQIAVLDNGIGMTRDQAINAMKLAATGPNEQRSPNDLGRFGLGLKTASLSQCRTLTLITKTGPDDLTALRWSLDHVVRTGKWSLLELPREQVEGDLGVSALESLHSGTLVHWQDLDQLSLSEGNDQSDLDRVAQKVKGHVALVFHLYNSRTGGRGIEFLMNGASIEPVDPFMSESRLTQSTPWETIEVEGQSVQLMAYTLPYLSRLSASKRDEMLRLGGLRETQGFYIYRRSRLVIWGTWFRMLPRSEMAKLTRVRVDIPNTLDHLWSLDVKKSHAEPPPMVRKRLAELARTMMAPSRRVQEFRGRKVTPIQDLDYMWELIVNGSEFHYEVNMNHQSIREFAEDLSDAQREMFSVLLNDLQTTYPVVDAHNRMSGDQVPAEHDSIEALLDRSSIAWAMARRHGVALEDFIANVSRAEPYCRVATFPAALRKVLQA